MKTSERNVYFDIEFHNLAHWKENVAHPCTILLKIVRHAQLTKFKNWHSALKRLPTPGFNSGFQQRNFSDITCKGGIISPNFTRLSISVFAGTFQPSSTISFGYIFLEVFNHILFADNS